MPTYEYVCTSCGTHLEVYQSFSDSPKEVCEVCSGKLRRVFHPVGVLFKGSGFYSTDARSSKAPANGEKAGSSKESKPDPAKSDTSPAPKSKPAATSSDST